MDFLINNIWLILFIFWGLPLGYYRSKFRKMVYETNHWSINIKPVFKKELKALFGNIFPNNKQYIKFRNFYRFYLSIYFILFITYNIFANKTSSMQTIKVGSSVPNFELFDQNGELFNLKDVIGKKNLVIYFYPKDDTPGCTKEACSFRDQFEIFEQADAKIIGISGQSVESHFKFAKKYNLNFTLLSDKGNKIRKLFNVPTDLMGFLPGRVTYIVDKQGKVVYLFKSQMQAEKHVENALEILKNLNK